MIYLKTTLTMKMEKGKLSEAEQGQIKAEWEELRGVIAKDTQLDPGIIVELKVEEVDEEPPVDIGPVFRKALDYIRNTGGNATVTNFLEDHAPVGRALWNDLVKSGLAREDERGKIFVV